MGCCLSEDTKEENAEPQRPKYSWEREDRMDRSVLMVSQQEGTVVTRLPGQLKGNQFVIQECKDCTILVLDYTETVTIDKCTNCQILVGPCRGSVFLRDCTNCRCVVSCQQFRSRDCKKCTLSLLSTTPPVIEASSKITFSCLQCNYPQLKELFDSANLSVFNNSWSAVHDFDGGTSSGNWSIQGGNNPVILDLPSEGEAADLGITFSREDSVVPLTIGPKQRPPDEGCLVAFFNESDTAAVSFVSAVSDRVTFVLTRRARLQSHEADRVFPDDQELASKASKGHAIFLVVSGTDCCQLCAQGLGAQGDNVYVSPTPEQGASDVEAFSSYLETNLGM